MKKRWGLILFGGLSICTVIVTVSATLQEQKTKGPRPATLQKADEDFYTIVDYATPEPGARAKQTSYKVRQRRYNMPPQRGVDPKRFAITEDRQSTFGLPPSHSPVEPALPVGQADAIVVGDVVSATAFLTEDKTNVLSEFTLHVTDLIRENLIAPFSVGDSLIAIRGGGGIRFESGKIIRYGSEGKPLPRVGTQYVFFLKYNDDEGKDYSIITAYALLPDGVVPLDGLALDGTTIPAYAAYQRYKGSSTTQFRIQVSEASVANPI